MWISREVERKRVINWNIHFLLNFDRIHTKQVQVRVFNFPLYYTENRLSNVLHYKVGDRWRSQHFKCLVWITARISHTKKIRSNCNDVSCYSSRLVCRYRMPTYLNLIAFFYDLLIVPFLFMSTRIFLFWETFHNLSKLRFRSHHGVYSSVFLATTETFDSS